MALKLEGNFSKEEIITYYFNTVDFGSNAFGLKTAAQTFFNKAPDSLNVQEGAVLVGLQKATTNYNPLKNPQALARTPECGAGADGQVRFPDQNAGRLDQCLAAGNGIYARKPLFRSGQLPQKCRSGLRKKMGGRKWVRSVHRWTANITTIDSRMQHVRRRSDQREDEAAAADVR